MNQWPCRLRPSTRPASFCNLVGAVLLVLFGVPAHRPLADAGKSNLLLEEDDPEERRRVYRVGSHYVPVGFAPGFSPRRPTRSRGRIV